MRQHILATGLALASLTAAAYAADRLDALGDPLPAHALLRLGTTRLRHEGVQGVCLSPDGKVLASGGNDGVCLWEVPSGRFLRRIEAQRDVHSVCFSPDGKVLASAHSKYPKSSSDPRAGFVRLLRTHTWELLGDLSVAREDPPQAVAFSPDGQHLACGDDATVLVWDLQTADVRRKLQAGRPAVSVAFSPDGKWLAARTRGGRIHVWDATSGAPRHIPEPVIKEGGSARSAVAFSADSRILATGGPRRVVYRWDVTTGEQMPNLVTSVRSVCVLAFSPDGKMLAVGDGVSEMELLDPGTGRVIRRCAERLGDHAVMDKVRNCEFSPSGQFLASGVGQRSIALWRAATGERIAAAGHDDRVLDVAFSPDGRTIASGSTDGHVCLWDAATGKVRNTFEPVLQRGIGIVEISQILSEPGGQTIVVVCGEQAYVIDSATGKSLQAVGNVNVQRLSPCSRLALAGNGRTLVVGRRDSLDVYDLARGTKLRSIEGLPGRPAFVALSADGKRLVCETGSARATGLEGIPTAELGFWDLETGTKYKAHSQQHAGGFGPLAISPDGKLVAAAAAGTVYDGASGQPKYEYPTGGLINCMAISPDGRWLATAGDAKITLRDLPSGQRKVDLQSHDGARISSLAFSPDGKRLISGSWDTTVLVWDIDGALRSAARS